MKNVRWLVPPVAAVLRWEEGGGFGKRRVIFRQWGEQPERFSRSVVFGSGSPGCRSGKTKGRKSPASEQAKVVMPASAFLKAGGSSSDGGAGFGKGLQGKGAFQ